MSKWTGYSAVATFLLYLFGYLALRFQLYTYGVAVGVDAFDERYFFAGCQFLIYLVMVVPSVVLILAILLLPIYGLFRIAPVGLKSRLHTSVSRWLSGPYRLRVLGCLVALVLIQFVFRQCVLLSDILLRPLPDFWITSLLIAGDAMHVFYFAGLVLCVGFSVAVLLYTLHEPPTPGALSTLLTALLIFLVAIELLLLPVNYGTLIASTSLPRVSQIDNQAKLDRGASAWLIWESKDALTYLVCENSSRSIMTVPKKENRVSIVAYDDIVEAVDRPPCSAAH